jgi:TonB family protein
MAQVQNKYSSHLFDYLIAEKEEKRNFYIALCIGIIFHIILAFIHFPKAKYTLSALEQAQKKVIVIKPPKFKPPEQQKQQEILKPQVKKIAIPDPTPDEPEPIREPEIDLRDQVIPEDFVIGIPENIPPPPEDDKPVIVGGDVQAPVRITPLNPIYPEAARKARIEGNVILQLTIDKNGNVIDVKVLRGLPMGLTEVAVEEAKKQKFKPAYRLSTKLPVDCIFTLTVTFKIQ